MDIGFDLEEPRFTQAQVLKMLPDLKAKQLQNWSSRGVLDDQRQKPGKGERRLYTSLGVVMLDFMVKMLAFGIPPTAARDMADHFAEAAISFVKREPEIVLQDDGRKWIPVRPDNIGSFRRALISPLTDGDYYFRFEGACPDDLDGFHMRTNMFGVILVEVDFMIAQSLNRIFLLEGGAL